MTLLEQTYTQLHSMQLVHCAQAFSTDYLHKNRNWYALQKHVQRDFSFATAIHCLRSTRSQQLSQHITRAQRHALNNIEQHLLVYLATQHSVADVA